MIVFERSGQRVSDFVVREPNMITNLIFSLFNEFEDMIRKHQIQQIHSNHNHESSIMINQYEDQLYFSFEIFIGGCISSFWPPSWLFS